VDRAGNANTGVHEAAARVAQGPRALVRAANADRLPQIGLGASVDRAAGVGTATGPGPVTLGQASVQVAYEPDLFGRASGRRDAAALDAQAREALLQSTRLAVQAETAQVYLELRALDVERALVRETVAAYADTLRLTQRRFHAGDIAELDVVRVEAEVAANESEALALEPATRRAGARAGGAGGQAASDFSLPPAAWNTALPVIPPGVPAHRAGAPPRRVGGPVRAAGRAATRRRGAGGLVPESVADGAGGFASSELGDLLRWSARAWTVGALLSLPIFDGGRREAGVQDARAQLDAGPGQLPRPRCWALPRGGGPAVGTAAVAGPGAGAGRAVDARGAPRPVGDALPQAAS
jgi:multidrug efflux system outer membrane protein